MTNQRLLVQKTVLLGRQNPKTKVQGRSLAITPLPYNLQDILMFYLCMRTFFYVIRIIWIFNIINKILIFYRAIRKTKSKNKSSGPKSSYSAAAIQPAGYSYVPPMPPFRGSQQPWYAGIRVACYRICLVLPGSVPSAVRRVSNFN
jgi:hypothetical protein